MYRRLATRFVVLLLIAGVAAYTAWRNGAREETVMAMGALVFAALSFLWQGWAEVRSAVPARPRIHGHERTAAPSSIVTGLWHGEPANEGREAASKRLYRDWCDTEPEIRSIHDRNSDLSRGNVRELWSSSLSKLALLEGVITALLHDTNHIVNEQDEPAANTTGSLLLLARGVRIYGEILCLLEGGWGAAALGRSRTLHEIAVITKFVLTSEVDLHSRMLLHDEWKLARLMRQDDDPTKETRAYIDRISQEVENGVDPARRKEWKKSYGWALDDPRFAHAGGVNLADIEAKIDMPSDARSAFALSSGEIHASATANALVLNASGDDRAINVVPNITDLAYPMVETVRNASLIATATGNLAALHAPHRRDQILGTLDALERLVADAYEAIDSEADSARPPQISG